MREEILKILEMVERGKVTAAQAEQLMAAMGVFDMQLPSIETKSGKAKRLIIKVVDAEGPNNVNVRVPVGVLRAGVELASLVSVSNNEALSKVDAAQILELVDAMLAAGEMGEVLSVESDDGTKVYVGLE